MATTYGPPATRKTVITIRTRKEGQETVKEIQATRVAEYFALHAAEGHRERWTLTHINSGLRITGGASQAALRQMAKRLVLVPEVDWRRSDREYFQPFKDACRIACTLVPSTQSTLYTRTQSTAEVR